MRGARLLAILIAVSHRAKREHRDPQTLIDPGCLSPNAVVLIYGSQLPDHRLTGNCPNTGVAATGKLGFRNVRMPAWELSHVSFGELSDAL
jgi:hypothetical protein